MSTTEKNIGVSAEQLQAILATVLTEARKPVKTEEQILDEATRKQMRADQEIINEQIRKNKEFDQKYCNHMQNNGKDNSHTAFVRVAINNRLLLHCQRCQVQAWDGSELFYRFASLTE